MIFDIFGAELDDVRVPIGRLRFDFAENLIRPLELRIRLHPIALTFGGVTFLDQEVRFKKFIARIIRCVSVGHGAKTHGN